MQIAVHHEDHCFIPVHLTNKGRDRFDPCLLASVHAPVSADDLIPEAVLLRANHNRIHDSVFLDALNTYYTTVVEKYDIINYKDDTRYYLEQRCTYEVKKQYDDTWMVSDFVGSIDVLDKTEY